MSKSNMPGLNRSATLAHIGTATSTNIAAVQSLSATLSDVISDSLINECPDLLLSKVYLTAASEIPAIIKSCQGDSTTSQHHLLIIVADSVRTTGDAQGKFDAENPVAATARQCRVDNTNDLFNQLVSVANQANVPVVAALTDFTLHGNAVCHNQPYRNQLHRKELHCTVNIREVHQQHDIALLIRQVFALLEIPLPENYKHSAYPVAPKKPWGAIPLEKDQLTDALSRHTPDWRIYTPSGNASATELHRKLHFSSFQAAIRYVHQVAPACDIANHHPRWENNWKTLRIWLTTWDAAQRITSRDIDLARYFDDVYADYD